MATSDQHKMEEFTFRFFNEGDQEQINLVKKHGHLLRRVKIILDQHEKLNRENACQVLDILAKTENQKVSSLSVVFDGENPLFYGGQEFIQSLKTFFYSEGFCTGLLAEVDLGGLWIDLTQELLDILSTHHPNLQKLDIQNQSLICRLHPDCLVRVVERCPGLEDLSLFYCSLSDRVLEALADDKRKQLKKLSIKCRRQENYIKPISSEAWEQLARRFPDLRVALFFDQDCFLEKISAILNKEIPVCDLRLETLTCVHEHILFAASNYGDTLEEVTIRTASSSDLETSLITLVKKCRLLKTLKVHCNISQTTKNEILSLCPRLEKNGDYILNVDS